MLYYISVVWITIVSGIAAYSDYKTQKIKNRLTAGTALAGLLFNFIIPEFSFKSSVLGLIVPFLICLLFYCLKIIRAGDVKLYMAIGAVMGVEWGLWCMAMSLIAGGIIAIFVAIKRHCFISRIKYLFEYFKNIFYFHKITAYMVDDKNSDGYFPFGIAIFAGVIVTAIFRYFE